MEIVITVSLILLGAYIMLGILFGIYFIVSGAPKIDSLMANSKKNVRYVLFPGIVCTWPFFIKKIFKSK